jgi:hypothetical protein
VGATFREDQPSKLLWRGRSEYLTRLAFNNDLLARERLQASLSGDQDIYRDICKRQMYARAELETRTFGLTMYEWVADDQYDMAGE